MIRQSWIAHSLRLSSGCISSPPSYLRCIFRATREWRSLQHHHHRAVKRCFATNTTANRASADPTRQPSLSFLLPTRAHATTAPQLSFGNSCSGHEESSAADSRPAMEIRQAPGKGRGLFATRALRRGEIVWSESPLLSSRLLSHDSAVADNAVVNDDQVDEVELVDQLDEDAERDAMEAEARGRTETKDFCANCHAPLMRPLLIAPVEAESDRYELVENADEVWNEMQRRPQLNKQLSALLSTAITRCRTVATDVVPPCEERYCSEDCEQSAWNFLHALEHMSDEEVRRFTHDNGAMAELMLDEDKVHVISLVLRAVAALRSCASSSASLSASSHQSKVLHALSQLSVPRNISTHVLSMQDWSGIEQAVGPLLTAVFADNKNSGWIDEQVMRKALNYVEGGNHMAREVLLLRALVGAIITNSFHLIRIQPSLVLTAARTTTTTSTSSSSKKAATNISVMSRPPLSVDGVTELPVFKQSYAALFGTACFLNHACEPFNNIAVELDNVDSTQVETTTPHRHSLVRFATLRDVAEGEELLYSYRQSDENSTQELELKYGFKCRCPRCAQKNQHA